MRRIVLAIVIFSLADFLVLADDPDASIKDNNEIDLEETREPRSPQDEFERGVMERLRAELRPRMSEFFRTDTSSVTDTEMKNLFEATFTPEEQKEIETIFTEVITKQMQSIMGNMGGFGGDLDDMTDGSPSFDDWDDGEDDHHHHHLYDKEFNTMDDNQKKFVLESMENPEDNEGESSNTEDGEDKIIISPAGEDDEL